MRIHQFYVDKENKLFIFNLQPEHHMEEGYGLDRLKEKQRTGEYRYSVLSTTIDKNIVPLIVIHRSRCGETEVERLNGKEVISTLNRVKDSFKYFLNDNFKEQKNTLFVNYRNMYLRQKQDKLFYTDNTFLSSFYYGEDLVLFPNPYALYFNKEELNILEEEEKHIQGTYSLKDDLRTKEFKKILMKRRKELFKSNCELFEKLHEMINRNHWCMTNRIDNFDIGDNICFCDREYINLIELYDIKPFKYDFENRVFSFKDKETLKSEIEDVKKELELENKLFKKVQPLLNKFKALGFTDIIAESVMFMKSNLHGEINDYCYFIKGSIRSGYVKSDEIYSWYSYSQLEELYKEKSNPK